MILSLVLGQETKNIVYLYLILLLSVITIYLNFILDVELGQGAGHLYSTS